MSKLPRVVILGRPNVGKSTLFNRICRHRRALVGNEPGMTRDRLYAPAEWFGKRFEVVDTGGMIPADKELIASEIFRQARVAIDEADQLILMVDARQGVVPLDEELAQRVRRIGRPLSLAVNKVDTDQLSPLAAEFHRLGIEHIFPLSAEHALGVNDLLDHVTRDFPVAEDSGSASDSAPVAEPEGELVNIHHAYLDKYNLCLVDNRYPFADRIPCRVTGKFWSGAIQNINFATR